MLDFLYEVRDEDTKPFGKHWCFNGSHFPDGSPILIAVYETSAETVRVFANATPALFYTVVVGNRRLLFSSSDGKLVAAISEGLSNGTIEIDDN